MHLKVGLEVSPGCILAQLIFLSWDPNVCQGQRYNFHVVEYPLWILPSWKVVPHQQLSAVLGYWLKNSGMVLGGQGTLRKTHLPRYSDLEEAEVKGDGTICLNCFASMPKNS